MAEWSAFHSRLLPRVIGCPVPVANAELRNSAEEFFSKTRAWREWLEPLQIYSDEVRDLDMDVPAGAYVIRVEAATKDGSPLPVDGAMTLSADPMRHPSGDGVSSTDRRVLMLSRSFPQGTRIQVQASLAPTEDAIGLPDHLTQQYASAIVAGALHRIRSLPNQVFTDDARSALDLAFFEREISRVSALVFRSHTNTVPRSRVKWC